MTQGCEPNAGAYCELYLEDAMTCLGSFFEFSVCDYGAEGSEVAELFAMSKLAPSFECGEPWLVAGKSGVEMFYLLCEVTGYAESPWVRPTFRDVPTPEYWAGWCYAYAQWRTRLSFLELFEHLPFDDAVEAYHPLHEADEERFVRLVRQRIAERPAGPTKLATLRRSLALTQQELAARSGVSLHSVQMYEQRRKSINRAQATNLQALARALDCRMEDLMELELPASVA